MKFHLKAFTSLLLTIIFLLLASSGVVLYCSPRGRVANWSGWNMLGLVKQAWQAVHINIALLFLIAALLHLFLNWSLFWYYIKQTGSLGLKMKAEILLAGAIAAFVFAGAIYQLPPFSTITSYSNEIKDYWDRQSGDEPGWGPGRGPGFGRGRGQGAGNRMEGLGPGPGQGRQGKVGERGAENQGNE